MVELLVTVKSDQRRRPRIDGKFQWKAGEAPDEPQDNNAKADVGLRFLLDLVGDEGELDIVCMYTLAKVLSVRLALLTGLEIGAILLRPKTMALSRPTLTPPKYFPRQKHLV